MKRKIGNIKHLGGNKYFLRLSCGFDDYGKRIQLTKSVECKNEREAEAELMKFYTEKEKLLEEKSSRAPETLKEIYDEWIKNHVSTLSVKTKDFYETLWNTHLKDKGKIKLKTIKAKHIFDIINPIDKDRTKQAIFKMLSTMLSKAVEWEYIDKNPCKTVKTPKYTAKEKTIYNKEDISVLLKILPSVELKYQAIVLFAILCGMRRGEIIGLSWNDINFESGMINIKNSAKQVKGKGTVILETKTEKSKRSLKLPEMIKPILKEMKKSQLKRRLKIANKWIDGNYVFTQWNGNLMCVTTISAWWSDFVKENNLPYITFHGLRHSAATILINSGVDIATTSGILGHAQKSTTLNIYAHVVEDSKTKALDDLEKILTNSDSVI